MKRLLATLLIVCLACPCLAQFTGYGNTQGTVYSTNSTSGGGGGGGYIANAVNYSSGAELDKTTVTGLADGTAGIVSFWIFISAGDGSVFDIVQTQSNAHFRILRNSSNHFEVKGVTSAGTTTLDVETSTAYTSSGGVWHHVIASWNLASTVAHLYVDDTESLAGGPTIANNSINYTDGTFRFCATDVNGCVAEFFFTTSFLDITSSSNRRLFDTGGTPPNLHPVSLGSTGITPLGSQPLVYMKDPSGTVTVNSGSGGNFTISGSVSACSSSP